MIKTIGRDSTCDYVISDPKKRVSRKHLVVSYLNGEYYIEDLNSTNGTFVNDIKCPPQKKIKISQKDKICLSTDYSINPFNVFNLNGADDSTLILNREQHKNDSTSKDGNRASFNSDGKIYEFDLDKTQIGELFQMDNTPYVTIGRNLDNKISIKNSNISRYHCKIRLITPIMLEIEDLGSANGTFADSEKLKPNVKQQFASSVVIKLGDSTTLDLVKILPGIQIIKKQVAQKPLNSNPKNNTVTEPTNAELKLFNGLETVWKEYIGRINETNNISSKFGNIGAAVGIVGALFGAGIVISMGSGLLGRYLGQQASNKVKNDFSYEDIFLSVYACPRCKESFQKKPWITIRDCYKCKTKYR
jgi:pSer/pThr/pTyr-binding forkhead associated (FHA) protein